MGDAVADIGQLFKLPEQVGPHGADVHGEQLVEICDRGLLETANFPDVAGNLGRTLVSISNCSPRSGLPLEASNGSFAPRSAIRRLIRPPHASM